MQISMDRIGIVSVTVKNFLFMIGSLMASIYYK